MARLHPYPRALRSLRLAALALGLLTAMLWGAGARAALGAASGDADRAAKIKAGVVLNFVRYTQWPDASFADASSPIVVLLAGETPLTEALERTLGGQKAHGRTIEVRRMPGGPLTPGAGAGPGDEESRRDAGRQLRAAHVVFVGDLDDAGVGNVLREVGAANVLTVSDTRSFAQRGGMLGLAVRDDRVAFDANTKKIKDTQLKVSSQLLRLAQVVESKEG